MRISQGGKLFSNDQHRMRQNQKGMHMEKRLQEIENGMLIFILTGPDIMGCSITYRIDLYSIESYFVICVFGTQLLGNFPGLGHSKPVTRKKSQHDWTGPPKRRAYFSFFSMSAWTEKPEAEQNSMIPGFLFSHENYI